VLCVCKDDQMGGGNCETGDAAPHDAQGVHWLAGGKERVLGLYIRQTTVQQAQLQSVCKKGRGWVNAAHLPIWACYDLTGKLSVTHVKANCI